MKNKINDLLFKDKINFIFSSRKITRKILVIGLLVFFSCFFTLNAQESSSNSDNAEGGFVSFSFLPAATISVTRSAGAGIPAVSSSESGTGTAPRVGYKFKNAQIHLSAYSFSADDTTIAINIIGADYIANNGFLIGYGLGSGSVDGCSGCSGSGGALNIGYKNIKSKGFTWGVHLVSSAISYSGENISFGRTETVTVAVGGAGLAIDIGYLF